MHSSTGENSPPTASSENRVSVVGKLRKKERAYARERAKGENKTESILKAGYNTSRQNASKMAFRMEKKEDIQAYITELREKHLSKDKLFQKHEQLLDADREEVQFKALEAAYRLHQMPGYSSQGTQQHLHVHQVTNKLFEDLDSGIIDGDINNSNPHAGEGEPE